MRDFKMAKWLAAILVLVINGLWIEARDLGCPLTLGLLHGSDEPPLTESWPTEFIKFINTETPFCQTFKMENIQLVGPRDIALNTTVIEIFKTIDILIGPFYIGVAVYAVRKEVLYLLTRPLDQRLSEVNRGDYLIEVWPTWSMAEDALIDYIGMRNEVKPIAILTMDSHPNTFDVSQALHNKLRPSCYVPSIEIFQYHDEGAWFIKGEIIRKKINTLIVVADNFSSGGPGDLGKLKTFFDHGGAVMGGSLHLDKEGFQIILLDMGYMNSKDLAKVGNANAKLVYMSQVPERGGNVPYTFEQESMKTASAIVNKLLTMPFLRTTEGFSLGMKNMTIDSYSAEEGLCESVHYNDRGQRSNCRISFFTASFGSSPQMLGSWTAPWGYGSAIAVSPVPALILLAILSKPYLSIKDNETIYSYEGIVEDIIKTMMVIIRSKPGNEQIDVFYKIQEDMVYGNKLENGSWTGLLGSLKVADENTLMGIGGIVKTTERSKDFQYMPGIAFSSIAFSVSKEGSTVELFRFLQPYDFKVWLGVIAAAVLAACLVYCLDRWNPMRDDIADIARYSPKESFWYSLLTVTQAGAEIVCTILPMRVFSIFYWFFSLIILACYTGNLTNFLTEPLFDRSTLKFSQILNSDVKIGLLTDGFVPEYFRKSMDKEMNEIYNEAVYLKSREAALGRVRKEEFALIDERLTLVEDALWDPGCELTVSDANVGSFEIAFPINPSALNDYNRGILQEMSEALLEMRLTGDIHKILKRWSVHNGGCPIKSFHTMDSTQLDIWHFMGLFLVAGVTLVLSFACLGFKVIRNRAKGKQGRDTFHLDGEQRENAFNTVSM